MSSKLDIRGRATAAIWHPRTAKTFRKLKDSTNQPLVAPEPISSLPMLSTTGVPIAQTQGTSNDCSTVLMGDFAQAILGLRETLTLLVLNETYAATGRSPHSAHPRRRWVRASESFVKLIGFSRSSLGDMGAAATAPVFVEGWVDFDTHPHSEGDGAAYP